MNALINEINAEMLNNFVIFKIEDTPLHRYEFLTGMQQAWNEDDSSSPEKTEYMNALQTEIDRLAAIVLA